MSLCIEGINATQLHLAKQNEHHFAVHLRALLTGEHQTLSLFIIERGSRKIRKSMIFLPLFIMLIFSLLKTVQVSIFCFLSWSVHFSPNFGYVVMIRSKILPACPHRLPGFSFLCSIWKRITILCLILSHFCSASNTFTSWASNLPSPLTSQEEIKSRTYEPFFTAGLEQTT